MKIFAPIRNMIREGDALHIYAAATVGKGLSKAVADWSDWRESAVITDMGKKACPIGRPPLISSIGGELLVDFLIDDVLSDPGKMFLSNTYKGLQLDFERDRIVDIAAVDRPDKSIGTDNVENSLVIAKRDGGSMQKSGGIDLDELLRRPTSIMHFGTPIRKTVDQERSPATAADAVSMGRALAEAMKDDPDFNELDPTSQQAVLAAATATAIRALQRAGIKVDDGVTGGSGEDPRTMNNRPGTSGFTGTAEKVARVVNLAKQSGYWPPELERHAGIDSIVSTDLDRAIMKRLSDPDRAAGAPGWSNSLLDPPATFGGTIRKGVGSDDFIEKVIEARTPTRRLLEFDVFNRGPTRAQGSVSKGCLETPEAEIVTGPHAMDVLAMRLSNRDREGVPGISKLLH